MCSATRRCSPRRRRPGADGARVRRGARRYYRTLLLGVAALGVLVWAAVERFGVSRQEMGELLIGALLLTGGVIGVAALGAGTWIGARRLLRRRRR